MGRSLNGCAGQLMALNGRRATEKWDAASQPLVLSPRGRIVFSQADTNHSSASDSVPSLMGAVSADATLRHSPPSGDD
jgi:hypothetical protein